MRRTTRSSRRCATSARNGVDVVTIGQYLQPSSKHATDRPLGAPRRVPLAPRAGRGARVRLGLRGPARPVELPRRRAAATRPRPASARSPTEPYRSLQTCRLEHGESRTPSLAGCGPRRKSYDLEDAEIDELTREYRSTGPTRSQVESVAAAATSRPIRKRRAGRGGIDSTRRTRYPRVMSRTLCRRGRLHRDPGRVRRRRGDGELRSSSAPGRQRLPSGRANVVTAITRPVRASTSSRDDGAGFVNAPCPVVRQRLRVARRGRVAAARRYGSGRACRPSPIAEPRRREAGSPLFRSSVLTVGATVAGHLHRAVTTRRSST